MVLMSQIAKVSKDIQPKVAPSGQLTGKTSKTGKQTKLVAKGGQAKIKKGCKTTPVVAATPGAKPAAKVAQKTIVVKSKGVSGVNTAALNGVSKDLTNKGKYKQAAKNVANVYARRSKMGL